MRRIKDKLQRDYGCPKCRNRGALVEEVTLPSGPFSRFMPVAGTRYFAVSCALCGFTEFYNPAVVVRAEETPPVAEEDIARGVENA